MNFSRNQVLRTGIAALLLFAGGWFAALPLLNFTLEFYRAVMHNVCFISTSVRGIFWERFFMALCPALLPFLAELFSYLLNYFTATAKERFGIFLTTMLIGYAAGYATEMLLAREALSHPIDPAVVSTVPVGQVFAYKFAFSIAIFFAALCWSFILVRRKSQMRRLSRSEETGD